MTPSPNSTTQTIPSHMHLPLSLLTLPSWTYNLDEALLQPGLPEKSRVAHRAGLRLLSRLAGMTGINGRGRHANSHGPHSLKTLSLHVCQHPAPAHAPDTPTAATRQPHSETHRQASHLPRRRRSRQRTGTPRFPDAHLGRRQRSQSALHTLHHFTDLKLSDSLGSVSGIDCKIRGVGNVVTRIICDDLTVNDVTFTNVMYAPDMIQRSHGGYQRLISVRKATERGCTFQFDNTACYDTQWTTIPTDPPEWTGLATDFKRPTCHRQRSSH